MTRFARAKGSKAANERAPEDSTPWEVMKEQLLQSKKNNEEDKKREEAEKQRIENYENFLKEHKVKKRKAEWCEFPETEKKLENDSLNPPKKKKKDKSKNTDQANVETVKQVTGFPSTKKSKKVKKNANTEHSINTVESSEQNESTETKKNKRSKKKKNKTESASTSETLPVANNVQPQNVEKDHSKKKKQKNKKSVPKTNEEHNENTSVKPNSNKDKQNAQGPKENNQKHLNQLKKSKDGQPTRRKPVQDRSFQLIINGKDVELVRFDGFPIMKKDAERLEELKKEMIKKGIPKSEVQRTLKLERRRAEKALARMKRDVCYNCRKGGHNLSDCPELKSKIPGVNAADGMCFKCGSTEHRQFECKVQKDKEFRFATCFICKEPGHIARQCPDNPKGLYPNGGSCKLCGDVTHLRKDCPTVHDKREEKSIKLQTLDSEDNIEGIEQPQTKTSFAGEQSKKPKKIKF